MDRETRKQILLHMIRWVSNILAETLQNYARSVSDEGANAMREAIRKLAEAEEHFQKQS